MNLSDELERARQIAHETGDVLRTFFASDDIGARPKGDRDVITEADLASERLVVERLRAAFPTDGIVAEEGAFQEARSSRRWYVDPLDGTLNFSRGVPLWCVSLALFDGDRPILGIVHDPIRGETFQAIRGMGAWKEERRLKTSTAPDLSSAFVHLTVDFHDGSRHLGLDDLVALAPSVLRTRNVGAVALALAYVAAGRFDGLLHRFAHTWDYGAGALLVEEAGGSISDFDGNPYTEATSAIVAAATDRLREQLIDCVSD